MYTYIHMYINIMGIDNLYFIFSDNTLTTKDRNTLLVS